MQEDNRRGISTERRFKMHEDSEERVKVRRVPQSLPSRGKSVTRAEKERRRSRTRSSSPVSSGSSRRRRRSAARRPAEGLFKGIKEENSDDSDEELMSDFYNGTKPFDFTKE